MSQNVTFLFSNPTIAEIPPLTHPTAIILQKPACKSRRGHLGAWFDPLGSVPTAIYPLCCSAAAACIFFVSSTLSRQILLHRSIHLHKRKELVFTRCHPSPTSWWRGKHLPGVGERQLRYSHHAELGRSHNKRYVRDLQKSMRLGSWAETAGFVDLPPRLACSEHWAVNLWRIRHV